MRKCKKGFRGLWRNARAPAGGVGGGGEKLKGRGIYKRKKNNRERGGGGGKNS